MMNNVLNAYSRREQKTAQCCTTVAISGMLFLMSSTLLLLREYEFLYQVKLLMLEPEPWTRDLSERSQSSLSTLVPIVFFRNMLYSLEVRLQNYYGLNSLLTQLLRHLLVFDW